MGVWRVAEWTELLRAVTPLVSLVILAPLGMRALRAYESYLRALGALERPESRRLNGSGE